MTPAERRQRTAASFRWSLIMSSMMIPPAYRSSCAGRPRVLNEIDRQAWLALILERIPDYKINCIDGLPAWNTASAAVPEADARSRKGGHSGRVRFSGTARPTLSLPWRTSTTSVLADFRSLTERMPQQGRPHRT